MKHYMRKGRFSALIQPLIGKPKPGGYGLASKLGQRHLPTSISP
jgi:hypothetical protein